MKNERTKKSESLAVPDEFLEPLRCPHCEHIIPSDSLMLRADAKAAVKTLAEAGEAGLTVIRYLIESYYDVQQSRIEFMGRLRAAGDVKAPAVLLSFVESRTADTEHAIKKLLDWYTDAEPTGMGLWAKDKIVGIGPVLSAALLAYINMDKATTPSAVWRYCGLDPSAKWLGREAGKELVRDVLGEKHRDAATIEQVAEIAQRANTRADRLLAFAQQYAEGKPITAAVLTQAVSRRPWNAFMKVIMWRVGDSFVKVHNREGAIYGQIYARRKALEVQRNTSGAYREAAARKLAEQRISNTELRETLLSGMLPPGQIEYRARRVAVKAFLVTYWKEYYWRRTGQIPSRSYAAEHGHHHADFVDFHDPALSFGER